MAAISPLLLNKCVPVTWVLAKDIYKLEMILGAGVPKMVFKSLILAILGTLIPNIVAYLSCSAGRTYFARTSIRSNKCVPVNPVVHKRTGNHDTGSSDRSNIKYVLVFL